MAFLNHDTNAETKPLLATDTDVQPLRYSELPRAVKNSRDAMAADSLTRYLVGADRSPALYELRENVLTTLSFATAIRQRRILTIDHGSAICAHRLPGDKPGKLLSLLARLSKVMVSKEAEKRATEAGDAIRELLKVLGDRMGDLIEIQSLATSPKHQGRGYGSALVEAVTSLADEQGRAVFLVTTDAYRFYEFVGFKLVGERQVGMDNPTWDGPPVAIRIMLREPHAEREREKGTGKGTVKTH